MIFFIKHYDHLNNFIIFEQHYEISGKSANSNLLSFNEFVASALITNHSVLAVYLNCANVPVKRIHLFFLDKL